MTKLPYRTIPGPKSQEYLKTAAACEPPCAADQTPIVWDHGQGVWVWDVDGYPYIDFTSGVLVTNLGHNHPGLVKAIQEQAPRLMNTYSFPTPERVTASDRLVKTFPKNLDRVFMLSTGSEATEAALRVARRYTGKQEVLSFFGGFHGRTYGAMGVAGSRGTRRGFGVPVPGGIVAPYGYCYRCFYEKTFPDCDMYCIKALDQLIASTSSGDLGTVIVEPYQGSAGFVFPPEGWLSALAIWAKERDLLLIIDEVQASFGRTGCMYAIQQEGIEPNMLCLGKGMGSGIPASAVAAESRIFECMSPGELSSTWGGNPLASAAVLAVLDAMEEEQLPERARKMGEYLKPRLMALQQKYPFLGDIRGRGLVFGLEIVEPGENKKPSPELCSLIIHGAAERGLLLGKVGQFGNIIRVAPPLVILPEELDQALDIFNSVFAQLV
ncbi:MAG: aspartate aminotransferase family protein [Chloroflexi bacterium]|nr:MAG: aspartate aminotransferase family protein [Chloroflexota bacterium]